MASLRPGESTLLPGLLPQPVLSVCLRFACLSFGAVLVVAGLQRGFELLGAGDPVGFAATGDGHRGVLLDLQAVLGFEERRHDEVLAAEVVAFVGEVRSELAVRAGGDLDFDGFEGDVGAVAEGG
jgi:hypothetical protein